MTDLRGFARDIRQLRDDIAELREDVDYLTALNEPTGTDPGTAGAVAGPGKPAGSTRAHVWHHLTGREAATAWSAITTWTDWLRRRYQLEDTIPDCWYRHAAIVDELDGLRAAWAAAYLNPNASAGEPANWLEQLGRALPRIREFDRYGCASGVHRDDPPTPPNDSLREQRDRCLHDDIAARIDQERRRADAAGRGGDGRGDAAGDVPGDAEPIP